MDGGVKNGGSGVKMNNVVTKTGIINGSKIIYKLCFDADTLPHRFCENLIQNSNDNSKSQNLLNHDN